MKRKLLFLIPIISLLMFLSSCNLFNSGQASSNGTIDKASSSSTPSSSTSTPSSNTSTKESTAITPSTSQATPTTSTPTSREISTNTPSETSTIANTEVYATSIVLEEENPSVFIETIDDDLEKIKMKVIYSDNSRESINLSRDLISNNDYELLKNPGDNIITVNYSGVSKNFTIKSSHMVKWEVNFLNYNNDVLKTEEVINGEAAMAPKNPGDYFDETSNKIYTFDKWDKNFNTITSNTDVKAVFKVKEKVGIDYLAVINSGTSADITIERKNSASIYNLRVMDESNHLIQAISNPTDKIELTNLNANTTYKISGTCMFYFNGKLQELNIVESSFKTGIFDDIKAINDSYVIDEDIISYDSIYVDLTSYIENAPHGYKLMGVALLDSDDNLVQELEYDGNNMVFFENLTPETNYTTYFFYDKIVTESLTDWTQGGYESNGNLYRYYFRGFSVQTSKADESMKCVRIVYNDPADGEVLLYRYYVSEGSSVSYGSYEYSNPFSFRMPIKYEDYIAIGDYRELENITADKTVEVLLFPINSAVDKDDHLVIFVESNSSYIISYQYVKNGTSVTPPEYDYTIPSDTTGKHYEKVWKARRGDSTVDNITSSTIFYPSYEMKEVLAEPTFTLVEYYTQVGSDFFYTQKSYNTKLALIENGEDIKLVKTSDNSVIPNSYTGESKNILYYKNLEPNTEYKFTNTYKYDINDNSGIKSKTYELVFTTSSNSLDYDNGLKITSPNYHTLEFTRTSGSSAVGIIAKKSLDSYDYNYTTFSSTRNTTSLDYLNTNQKYYIYTYTENPGEVKYKRLSGVVKEFTTLDSEEPIIFRIQIHVKKDKNGNYIAYNGNDLVRLYIDNFDVQKDIGTLQGDYYVNDPFSDYNSGYYHNNWPISFEFDASKGYYVNPFYNFYSDFINTETIHKDPETGQEYRSHTHLDNLVIFYQYNGTQQAITISYIPQGGESNYESYVKNFTEPTGWEHGYIKYEIIVH